MSESIEQRLREAHPKSAQYAGGSNLLLEAADKIAELEKFKAHIDRLAKMHTTLLKEPEAMAMVSREAVIEQLKAVMRF